MSLTEQDLRDLLAQRAADAPGPGAHAMAVARRGTRERRRDAVLALAGVAVLTVGVVGGVHVSTRDASGRAPVPGGEPTASATTSAPRHITTSVWMVDLDGLHITTTGPTVTRGWSGAASRAEHPADPPNPEYHPFSVTVELVNRTAKTWSGTVGAGRYGYDVADYPLSPADEDGPVHGGHGRPQWFDLVLSGPRPGDRLAGMVDPATQVVRPGERISVVIWMVNPFIGSPSGARGWVPVLDPNRASQARYPDPESYPLLD